MGFFYNIVLSCKYFEQADYESIITKYALNFLNDDLFKKQDSFKQIVLSIGKTFPKL